MPPRGPPNVVMKFIVVGESGVGKSCLLHRFVRDRFRRGHDSTIGVDFDARELDVETVEGGTHPCKVQIWDTAGQESFLSLTRSYYRGAAGVLLVYDVTRRASFQQLDRWLADLRQTCPVNVEVTIVGNKNDDPTARQVSAAEGQAFADRHELRFVETSAKHDTNVDVAFRETAAAVLARVQRGEFDPETSSARGVTLRPGYPKAAAPLDPFDATAPLLLRRGGRGARACCR